MSNASLKEQLQAMASQLTDTNGKPKNRPNKPAGKMQAPIIAKANRPKPQWLEYAQYGVELLKTYFPAGFKAVNEIRPLKKGIKEDLVKRLSTLGAIVTEDKACMVKSLSYYVNTATYHKCVVEGAARIDMDGQPAGVVTAEEAKYSLEKLQAKQAARNEGSTSQPIKTKEIITE